MKRVFRVIYKNKAKIEVFVSKTQIKGLHNADRIKINLVSENGKGLTHFIHALEAQDIITGLSMATAELMVKELPLMSKD